MASLRSYTLKKPRPAVDWVMPKELPGKPISELKGKHSGAVALFFNGASLAKQDLSSIRFPKIGMNRTHVGCPGYEGPQTDYLCIVDKIWFSHPQWRNSVRSHPAIINGSEHEEAYGYRTRRNWSVLFSFDLEKGYGCPIPCTVGHLAIQAAVYMGFTDLYCLGFDLGGEHFDGTRASRGFEEAAKAHQAQAKILKDAGINVYVVGSPESKAPFPHMTFAEAFLA